MEEVKEFVQLTIDDYMRYKNQLMQELNNLANGFICAGYYLKKIRDSETYRNDGYGNIYEFAQGEYGITRTVASRFMSINDRFSKDGYSLELMEQYKGLGPSRLTEMLTLDAADHEMVTNVTRIEDIRELKRFERQEPETAATAYCELYRDFFREKEKEFNAVMQMENIRDIAEIVNPSGNKTWKYRMLFMAMKEYDKGISIKDLLKPAPETITWEQFVEQCRSIFAYDHEAAGTPYEQNYRNSESEEPEKTVLKETEDKNSATLKENVSPGDSGKEKNKNVVSMPEEYKEIVNERAEDEKDKDQEESKAAGTDKTTEVQSKEKTEVVEGEVENAVCDIEQTTDFLNGAEKSTGFTVTFPTAIGEGIYAIEPKSMDEDGKCKYGYTIITPYLYEIRGKNNIKMYYHKDSGESDMVDIRNMKERHIYPGIADIEEVLEELNGKEK